MNNIIKIICVVLTIVTIVSFSACNNEDVYNQKDDVNSHSIIYRNQNDDNNIKYPDFIWKNDDTITALSETGKKKTTLEIPANCKKIEQGVFAEKGSKTKEVIFKGSSNVELDRSFTDASTIEKITFPEKQAEINSHELAGCTNLKEISVSETTSIDTNVFGKDRKAESVIVNISENTSVQSTEAKTTQDSDYTKESKENKNISKTESSTNLQTSGQTTTKKNEITTKKTDSNTNSTTKNNKEKTTINYDDYTTKYKFKAVLGEDKRIKVVVDENK